MLKKVPPANKLRQHLLTTPLMSPPINDNTTPTLESSLPKSIEPSRNSRKMSIPFNSNNDLDLKSNKNVLTSNRESNTTNQRMDMELY